MRRASRVSPFSSWMAAATRTRPPWRPGARPPNRLAYRVGNPPDNRTYLTDLSQPGSNEVLLFNSGIPSWSEAVAGAPPVSEDAEVDEPEEDSA